MNAPTALYPRALRDEMRTLVESNPSLSPEELAAAFVEHHPEHEPHDVALRLYWLLSYPQGQRTTAFGTCRAAWAYVDPKLEREIDEREYDFDDFFATEVEPDEEDDLDDEDRDDEEEDDAEDEDDEDDEEGGTFRHAFDAAGEDADGELSTSPYWEYEFLPGLFVSLERDGPDWWVVTLAFAGTGTSLHEAEVEVDDLAEAQQAALTVAEEYLISGLHAIGCRDVAPEAS